MNGVGLEFNHLFGFGVLDAGAMTALAANWRSVPPRYHCEAGSVNTHMLVLIQLLIFLEGFLGESDEDADFQSDLPFSLYLPEFPIFVDKKISRMKLACG